MPKPAPALWLATVMASISPSVGAQSPQAPAIPADPKPYFTEPAIAPDRSEIAFVSGGDICALTEMCADCNENGVEPLSF